MNTLIVNTFRQITLCTTALMLALAGNFAYGQWADPVQAPTDGNITVPVNVSGDYQVKEGDLGATRVRSDQYCDADGNNCFTPTATSSTDGADQNVRGTLPAALFDAAGIITNVNFPDAIVCDDVIKNFAGFADDNKTEVLYGDGGDILRGNYTEISIADGAYSGSSWSSDRLDNCAPFATETIDTIDKLCAEGLCIFYDVVKSARPAGQEITDCRLSGVTIADGGDRTFYSARYATNCSSVSGTRTCNNRVLGGGTQYDEPSCSRACSYNGKLLIGTCTRSFGYNGDNYTVQYAQCVNGSVTFGGYKQESSVAPGPAC